MGWRRPAAVVAATLAGLALPAPAHAAEACQNPPPVAAIAKGVPVEDQVYAPQRLAPFATGRGIRVAVIDSGVDPTNPQLHDRVARGADFLHNGPTGRQDCVGHGTAVASIIAATPSADTGFQGLAPDALIIPVRISEQTDVDGKPVGEPGKPEHFAEAIDFAVAQHADVINMSLVMTVDSDVVHRAVERAIGAGVVVVAAAGNLGRPQDSNPTPYPASYEGVIGVGAVDAAGSRADFSQHGTYVDLVAIGKDVTVASRAGGHESREGTSFATPFVAATAALIKQRFPGLSPAQVRQRLVATADPAPGGAWSEEYGFGLLNPYRAVTQTLGQDARAAPPPATMRIDDSAAVALAARRAHAQDTAVMFGAVGLGVVLLLAAVAVIAQRGRRRGWRAATPGAG
jgi:membrane-anchored mycosin MYCP